MFMILRHKGQQGSLVIDLTSIENKYVTEHAFNFCDGRNCTVYLNLILFRENSFNFEMKLMTLVLAPEVKYFHCCQVYCSKCYSNFVFTA